MIKNSTKNKLSSLNDSLFKISGACLFYNGTLETLIRLIIWTKVSNFESAFFDTLLFNLNCWFSFLVSLWLAYFLLSWETMEKLSELCKKMTLSSTFLIRLRFQGYLCKSVIAIFAWSVTGNYAYSPFS